MIPLLLVVAVLAGKVCSSQTFTLKSRDLGGQATQKQILPGFGCTGENISPQLYWEQAPAGTKSFAVTMYDEDAPTGSGWWHWLIFDINKSVTELSSDAGNSKSKLAPKGSVQSKTDFGREGYSGPCPPAGSGFHRYVITVYALKVEKLGLDENASPAMVGYYLHEHTIQKASLLFYYKHS
ncbi:YbhB/YbcL family Raf kinase inhibitor-like protein [Lacibacter sp. H375]|uniref:YbhB/YbcL family Raf kinase inhibitor-like protein n=1 Tax=Lacibacter sp. H375 TaxID=3133424 RepID=UPI0030BFC611